MERTTADILAEAIVNTSRAMAMFTRQMDETIDALNEAGEAGAQMGKILREYAVAKISEGERP